MGHHSRKQRTKVGGELFCCAMISMPCVVPSRILWHLPESSKMHEHRSLHNKYCIYVSLVVNFPEKIFPQMVISMINPHLRKDQRITLKKSKLLVQKDVSIIWVVPLTGNSGEWRFRLVSPSLKIWNVLVVTIPSKVQHPKVYYRILLY